MKAHKNIIEFTTKLSYSLIIIFILFVIFIGTTHPPQGIYSDKIYLNIVYENYYSKSHDQGNFTLENAGLKTDLDNQSIRKEFIVDGKIKQTICMTRRSIYKEKGELYLSDDGSIFFVHIKNNNGITINDFWDAYWAFY